MSHTPEQIVTKTLTKPDKAEVMVPAGPNPLAQAQALVAGGVDPKAIGEMLTLQERWEDRQAKNAFGLAIAKFQAQCPIIPKSQKADRYSYAGYDDIWARIKPLLGETGIAVGFSSPGREDNDRYQTVVRLRVGSHFEDYPFVAPWPNLAEVAKRQNISEPQAMGTIQSYYKRYALCSALGIVTGDEDLDGKFTTSTVSEEQAEEIEKLLKETGVNRARFLTWLEVTKVEDILGRSYVKAVNHLNEKKGGAK